MDYRIGQRTHMRAHSPFQCRERERERDSMTYDLYDSLAGRRFNGYAHTPGRQHKLYLAAIISTFYADCTLRSNSLSLSRTCNMHK